MHTLEVKSNSLESNVFELMGMCSVKVVVPWQKVGAFDTEIAHPAHWSSYSLMVIWSPFSRAACGTEPPHCCLWQGMLHTIPACLCKLLPSSYIPHQVHMRAVSAHSGLWPPAPPLSPSFLLPSGGIVPLLDLPFTQDVMSSNTFPPVGLFGLCTWSLFFASICLRQHTSFPSGSEILSCACACRPEWACYWPLALQGGADAILCKCQVTPWHGKNS